jgi:CMP-N-acetylneuraminic acid synthetase
MPLDCVAIIPARGGSKRLPGKNLRMLGGRPLIDWTLRVACAEKGLRRVIVSTDAPIIAETAIRLGGEAPWLRSAETSTDTASSIEVVQEVLHRLKSEEGRLPEAVMLLQPTSPFRTADTVHKAIELFSATRESVIAVSPAASHPQWCYSVDQEGRLREWPKTGSPVSRSQDLPPAYVLNGSIYLASVVTLQNRNSFYSEHPRALIVDSEIESIDIDTPFDMLVAEAVVANGLAKPGPTP